MRHFVLIVVLIVINVQLPWHNVKCDYLKPRKNITIQIINENNKHKTTFGTVSK